MAKALPSRSKKLGRDAQKLRGAARETVVRDKAARRQIRLLFRQGLDQNRRIQRRYIRNLRVGTKAYGLFFLPDYPKLLQDEIRVLNEKTVRSVFIDARKERFVQFRHSFGRSFGRKLLPKGKLINYVRDRLGQDPGYIDRLAARELLWRARLERAVEGAEDCLQSGQIGRIRVRALFDRLTDYSSLNLLQLFDDRFFLETLERVKYPVRSADGKAKVFTEAGLMDFQDVANLLRMPAEGAFSYEEFRKGELQALIQMLRGKKVDYEKFARETGCLAADLFQPRVESPEKIESEIKKLAGRYLDRYGNEAGAITAAEKDLQEIERGKEAIKSKRRVLLFDLHLAAARFGPEREVFDSVVMFPGVVAEYVERHRILRMKSFRIFRVLMESQGLDVNNTSFAELQEALKKYKHQ